MLFLLMGGCTKSNPIHSFMNQQKKKIEERRIVIQADPLFTVHVYKPRREDLEGIRAAWRDHAKTFPESAEFSRVEDAVREPGSEPILMALYTPDIDRADLKSKTLGWSVYPKPRKVEELKNNDAVLRVLFPLDNTWARYYLLYYGAASPIAEGGTLIVGLPERSVEVPVK
jgi:hypothetical protein